MNLVSPISNLSYALPNYIYIPAGSNQKIMGELKHNLILGNKTILENAIEAGANLEQIIISTVKESQKIRKKYSRAENILILEAREKLIDSGIYGLIEGYINHYYEANFNTNWANFNKLNHFLKENPKLLDLTVLGVGSDSPFLNSQDLSGFIQRYNDLKEKPDIYVGLTNMEKIIEMNRVVNLDIFNLKSTVNNYCITDRGFYRISNMYMLKPFKMLTAGITGSLQKIYDNRKLSQGITEFLGMTSGLLLMGNKVLQNPNSFYKFVKDIYISKNHFRGKYLGNVIELDNAFKNTSKFVGLNVQADLNCGLGPLLDIDDENSYIFLKENYDVIRKYLLNNL